MSKKVMMSKKYKMYAYLDLHTGEGFIYVGTKKLVKKTGASKSLIYSRLKKDGWHIDEDMVLFSVDPKNFIRGMMRNNNLAEVNRQRHLDNTKKPITNGTELSAKTGVKIKKSTTKKNHTDTAQPIEIPKPAAEIPQPLPEPVKLKPTEVDHALEIKLAEAVEKNKAADKKPDKPSHTTLLTINPDTLV